MKIGVIGAGKVGTALAHAMKARGLVVVSMCDIDAEALETARGYVGEGPAYTTDAAGVVKTADVIAVTTQDREIRSVAKTLAERFERFDGKLFFHTSGAHPSSELAPLDKKGAILGSLHPLQTFPDIDSGIAALPTTYVFIEGDERAIAVLEEIGSTIGHKAVRIDSANKVLYHLSAVVVCNLLSALMYTGEDVMRRIGIDLGPFFPIIEATLKNIEAKGPLLALTGPVVRGDAETVAAHLGAIHGMEPVRTVYRALSRVALAMSEERGTLTAEQVDALRRLLEDGE
jgi:predicted short-subunit dehydrogenase-like oxidoreductase (DUF2520 family)